MTGVVFRVGRGSRDAAMGGALQPKVILEVDLLGRRLCRSGVARRAEDMGWSGA